jgi:REP element-mobilizing transposase RayT
MVLREHVEQFDLAVLDYCVTFNHVHLLEDAPDRLTAWSQGFVEKVKPLTSFRSRTEMVPTDEVWVLKAAVILYGQKTSVRAQ